MDTCPHCHRKLLSHASANCNWCGVAIDDPAYQAEAKKEQDAFVAHDEQRIALDQARINNMRWQNNIQAPFGRPGFGLLGSTRQSFSPFSSSLLNQPISPPDPVIPMLPSRAPTPRSAPQSAETPPFAVGLGMGLASEPALAPQAPADHSQVAQGEQACEPEESELQQRFHDLELDDKPARP